MRPIRFTILAPLALALVAAPLATEAQLAGKVHRIGVIVPGSGHPADIREMTEHLRGRGWVDGQNIVLEYRLDEGKRERLPTLAADLVDLKVSVIVAVGTTAALAAQRATATLAIVMVNVGNPCAVGSWRVCPVPAGT